MIRRFNYTNRKTIDRSHTNVTLHELDDGCCYFEVTIDLGSYSFPEDALVRVEAWRSNAAQRWSLGTVGRLRNPSRSERILSDVPDTAQFRVAVVAADDSGLLFGLSKDLRPAKVSTDSGNGNGGRGGESMLPVQLVDGLGEEVWRLDFGEGEPVVMEVNKAIDGIADIVARDAAFRSLVMPDVFRAVLHRAILVDRIDPDDSQEHPWSDWIDLAKRHAPDADVPAITDENDSQQRASALIWVETVIRSFASQSGFSAATTYAAAVRVES